VATPRVAPSEGFSIRGDRRCGIDRLSLVGALDRSSVLVLESELTRFDRAQGALILDLRLLTSIDEWGLRALDRATQRASGDAFRLAIVNGSGPVTDVFEAAGVGHLLSGTDVSDLLESGDAAWSPISLPSFLGQRARERIAYGHGGANAPQRT
jgi:anti-anti-sigma regulatory factor